MCGIAGLFLGRGLTDAGLPLGRGADAEHLTAMTTALQHRGPDDQGVQTGHGWGLGSRRLAIIGVGNGHQPLANEDETVWVAFNGEIYNHRMLRAELEARGHAFRTTTDTEILVHLYEECGAALVSRLCGMYAFAVVDTARRRMLLARDRLGQKPLFYHVAADGSVYFASELHALLMHPKVPRSVRLQSVHDYLSLMYVPAPFTVYRDVLKLPPASLIRLDGDSAATPSPERYWVPRCEPKASLRFGEAQERVGELLVQAVSKRLESEVPLGAFLSGGIDSSVVVALMRQHSEAVHTYTIGFADARYDERAYAATVAHHVGAAHHDRLCEPRDLDLLRRLVRHCGEPFCDSSILPTALLSRFTAEHVTVALSGDGGDELFGGYRRYQVMAALRYIQAIPVRWRRVFCDSVLACLPEALDRRTRLATLRRLLVASRSGGVAAYATFQEVFSEDMTRELLSEQTLDQDAAPMQSYLGHWEAALSSGSGRDFVERYMELDLLTYLPSDLLYKVDIASMLYSLEVRCPFLDHELVEFVLSLPRSYKVGLFGRKRLLSACAGRWLPDAILHRGKLGFGVPVSQWFRTEWRDVLIRIFELDSGESLPGLNKATVRRLVAEHVDGRADHGSRLWSLLCYRLWEQGREC